MLSSRGAITTSVAMMECASGQNMSGGCVFLLSELEKVWVTLSVLLRQLLLSPESDPGRHVEIAYFGSFWTEPRVAYVDVHKRRYEVRVLCFGVNDNFATRYGIDTTHIPRDNLHKSVGPAFRIHMADIVTVCSVPAQIAHVALKEFFLYIGEGLYKHRVFNLTFPGVATMIIKRERYMMTPDESLLNDLFALDSHKWSDSVRSACYARLCALTNKSTHGSYGNGDRSVNSTQKREYSSNTSFSTSASTAKATSSKVQSSFMPTMEEKISLHTEKENGYENEKQQHQQEQCELQKLAPSSARAHSANSLRAHSLPTSPCRESSVPNDSFTNQPELSEQENNRNRRKNYAYNTISKSQMRNCRQHAKNDQHAAKAFVSAAPSGRLFADIEQETRRRRNTEYYMNAIQLDEKSNISLYGERQTSLNGFCNVEECEHSSRPSKKRTVQCKENKYKTHESIYKLYESKKIDNNKYMTNNKSTKIATDIESASDEPEIEEVEVICPNGVDSIENKKESLQTEDGKTREHSQTRSAPHRPLYNKNAELEQILRQEERFSRPISRHAYHDASSARDLIYHQSTLCNQSSNSSSNKQNEEVYKQREGGKNAATCDGIANTSTSKSQLNGQKRFSAFLTSDVDHVAPLMKIREYEDSNMETIQQSGYFL